MGENHIIISYIYQEYIHRKHQIPNSPTPTGRRHQPPNLHSPTRRKHQHFEFSNTNRKEATIPWFTGTNLKEAPTLWFLWHQPKVGYKSISFPHIASLKYKCRLIVTTTNQHVTSIVTDTSTNLSLPLSHQPSCHYHINQPTIVTIT